MKTLSSEDLDNIATEYGLPFDAVPPEMLDFLKVVKMGSLKYAMNNWLEPDGKSSNERAMHDSMFHHLAESFTGLSYYHDNSRFPKDKESGLDPLLHLACRALMLYTRRQRGIIHSLDNVC